MNARWFHSLRLLLHGTIVQLTNFTRQVKGEKKIASSGLESDVFFNPEREESSR